ncbi:hypothetical protein GCK72_008521 [Caenorhabditis remanei]|uniref:Uncharacterized protein n=1 Tax=Caenorhabditis remanei TaxID=31234 RepID=A0A6A5H087_CAERE|nr:hypothetical protein GCK72_008521 [Caenorhabditis remanei]KAF1760275.1 hypothetical protein GCK72_008521 [Caenorhabditis remanei]
MLDFTHGEFSNTNESLTWRDLISEAKTDLSGGEWKFSLIELEKSLEIHKDSLSGFWAEECFEVAGWSDLSGEHQIESDRFGEVVSSDGGLELESCDDFMHILVVESFETSQHVFSVFLHFGGDLLVLEFGKIV